MSRCITSLLLHRSSKCDTVCPSPASCTSEMTSSGDGDGDSRGHIRRCENGSLQWLDAWEKSEEAGMSIGVERTAQCRGAQAEPSAQRMRRQVALVL